MSFIQTARTRPEDQQPPPGGGGAPDSLGISAIGSYSERALPYHNGPIPDFAVL
jgi:hypothetical protein